VDPLYPNQNNLKNKNKNISTQLFLQHDLPSTPLMTEEETSINETLTMRNTISSFLDIFIVSAIARVEMVVLNCLKNKQVNTFI
jgi:hypothetical protein